MIPLFRRHLDPAELALAALAGADDRAAAHLAACPQCRRECDRLAGTLADDRAAAHTAAAEAFPGVDLEQQRLSIQQRIARLGGVARVLPFPGAPPPSAGDTVSTDRRWVMAAAAAGLVLGMLVGRLPGRAPGDERAVTTGRMAEVLPGDPVRDDPLLSGVEEVLTRESRPEFEALDELTPFTDEGR